MVGQGSSVVSICKDEVWLGWFVDELKTASCKYIGIIAAL